MWHRSHICTQGLGFFYQVSVDNKGLIISLNWKSYPGHHFEPVYCIVNRFNSRVQLLRTKQRVLRIRRNVGCCCRSLLVPPSDTSITNLLTPRSILLFYLFTLLSPDSPISAFSQQHNFPTSLSGLNRVNCLRRHLTIAQVQINTSNKDTRLI